MRPGRVVVTGHTGDGVAAVAADRSADPTPLAAAGVVAHFLWGRDGVPTYPDDGGLPAALDGFPAPGGCRVSTLTIPAGANGAYHEFVAQALGELADPERPGFHRTPTLDVVLVLAGRLLLETDGGRTVLGPGDVIVQNGTSHRWSNAGDDDVVIASVVLGAHTDPGRPLEGPR